MEQDPEEPGLLWPQRMRNSSVRAQGYTDDLSEAYIVRIGCVTVSTRQATPFAGARRRQSLPISSS